MEDTDLLGQQRPVKLPVFPPACQQFLYHRDDTGTSCLVPGFIEQDRRQAHGPGTFVRLPRQRVDSVLVGWSLNGGAAGKRAGQQGKRV